MLPNRSMPRCAVIPVLVYDDVGEAIVWLCEKFGFTERWRVDNHRAQLSVGDGAAVALTQGRGALSDSVMVRVEDVSRHHERARQRGARVLQPPTDYPYGEKQYSAEDLAGRRWTFSQTIADIAPEAWGGVSRMLE